MPLGPKEEKDLKAKLKRARKKELPFFYCQEGPDGDPILAIVKPINAEKKRIRKVAKTKVYVQGIVRRVGDNIAFVSPDVAKGKFELKLKQYFGRRVAEMKTALVLTPEQLDVVADAAPKGKKKPAPENKKNRRRVASLQPVFEAGPRQMSDAELDELGGLLSGLSKNGDGSSAKLAKRTKRDVRHRKRIRSAAAGVKK